jgi:hypothetical protein
LSNLICAPHAVKMQDGGVAYMVVHPPTPTLNCKYWKVGDNTFLFVCQNTFWSPLNWCWLRQTPPIIYIALVEYVLSIYVLWKFRISVLCALSNGPKILEFIWFRSINSCILESEASKHTLTPQRCIFSALKKSNTRLDKYLCFTSCNITCLKYDSNLQQPTVSLSGTKWKKMTEIFWV